MRLLLVTASPERPHPTYAEPDNISLDAEPRTERTGPDWALRASTSDWPAAQP